MTLADTTAVSVCFDVQIDMHGDKHYLGSFSSCEGLGCEVILETREEGGNNGFVWQLPTRMKYPNIKLTRPLGTDTTKIARWLSSLGHGVRRTTAVIQAKTLEGTVVGQWSLTGVVPVRWTGPSLNLDSPKPATETIEIAHHGFLPEGHG